MFTRPRVSVGPRTESPCGRVHRTVCPPLQEGLASEQRTPIQIPLISGVLTNSGDGEDALHRSCVDPGKPVGDVSAGEPILGTCLPPRGLSEGPGCGPERAFCHIEVRVLKLLLTKAPSCRVRCYANSDVQNGGQWSWTEEGRGARPATPVPPSLAHASSRSTTSLPLCRGGVEARSRAACPRSPSPRVPDEYP